MAATNSYDVVILGCGAAGMLCAIEAGKRGRSVLVVDHADVAGEKIRISGGGRCNFTNLFATGQTARDRFLSQNPRFALSALSRYTPHMFIALVKSHGITFHEKALGQLFCDGPATQVITMLRTEMAKVGVVVALGTTAERVERNEAGFSLALSSGTVSAKSLIVATGGKSIPKLGASGLGYQLAQQFALRVTETRPGLVPLTFAEQVLAPMRPLSGIAVDATVRRGKVRFSEPVLFTHRGLSGPAILQISSYWREGDDVAVDLLPGQPLLEILRDARRTTPKLALQTVLSQHLPKRLAQFLAEQIGLAGMIGDFSDAKLRSVADLVQNWTVRPVGSEGYRTAEVTLGGVDTRDLDARTMEARAVPGLYFIGEVVDVTGWLGGYNFQWAWASGWAAGQVA